MSSASWPSRDVQSEYLSYFLCWYTSEALESLVFYCLASRVDREQPATLLQCVIPIEHQEQVMPCGKQCHHQEARNKVEGSHCHDRRVYCLYLPERRFVRLSRPLNIFASCLLDHRGLVCACVFPTKLARHL